MAGKPWSDNPQHGQYVPENKKLKKTLLLRLTESDFDSLVDLAQKENATSVEFIRRLVIKELSKIA